MYEFRCQYGHTWNVSVPPDLGLYDKADRFCRQCLEFDRIEVASIKIRSSMGFGQTMLLVCPKCQKSTYVPLLTDISGLALVEELPDLFAVQDLWYRLPRRWPTCFYCHHQL